MLLGVLTIVCTRKAGQPRAATGHSPATCLVQPQILPSHSWAQPLHLPCAHEPALMPTWVHPIKMKNAMIYQRKIVQWQQSTLFGPENKSGDAFHNYWYIIVLWSLPNTKAWIQSKWEWRRIYYAQTYNTDRLAKCMNLLCISLVAQSSLASQIQTMGKEGPDDTW